MTLHIPEQFNIATYFLDRLAAQHPERMAVVGGVQPLTYRELQALTDRVGNALLSSGCKKGDRVLLALPDCGEFIASFLGAVKIGAIAVPVNPFSRGGDFAYYIQDCGASFVIVDESVLHAFDYPPDKLDDHGGLKLPTIIVGASPGSYDVECKVAWPDWLRDASPHLQAAPTQAIDPAFFLYTSGSTGGPKAAVHQHQDMLATFETFARGILGITEKDRTFSVSKLFFAYGLGNGMYFPLGAGAATVLDAERPRPARVLALVEKLRPTIFFSVPTFYAALLREAEGQKVDFSSVRMAVSAGEALPEEIFKNFKQRFGLEILDAIGSTEMLHMFISNAPGKIRAGSCGMPLPGYHAQIVDEHGNGVTGGEVGNLWVRGPSAFAGYWNKPEKTRAAKNGDWVMTGDKFYRDADGYYFYCGRADDMMKVSGLWVAPAEVENVLLGHPAVAEAAVVGHAQDGLTRMTGYVVLRAGHTGSGLIAEDIRQWMRARLAGYKCPQETVFVAELPKTATGKIQRFRLRQGT